MVELVATSPCEGLLPVEIGACRLSEELMQPLAVVSVYKGQDAALAKALKAAHGLKKPGPGEVSEAGAVRAIWFAQGQILLMGATPDESLSQFAAVTDQSDAWAAVRLEGAAVDDVLARLVAVDLRENGLHNPYTWRTHLVHMSVSLSRVAPGTYLILAFRSMAHTLVHDIKTAMEAVAARG